MSEGLPPIMLVEDCEDDYEATKRSFKRNRFMNPLIWCNNGDAAIRELGNESNTLPHIILLDLNMAGTDGMAVLKFVKSQANLKKIPVIILTTSKDRNDVEKCYELGASTYIQKPVSFDGLIDAVKKIQDYWYGVAVLPQAN